MLDEENNNPLEAEDGKVSKSVSKTEENAETSMEKNEIEIHENTIAEDNAIQTEIDASNAEDAEDEDNKHRYALPLLDYHAMSMEELANELKKLVENEKVQAIKKHVEDIKYEFDLKCQEFLEQKKGDFISDGGNEIDFKYQFPLKALFNKTYFVYKEKRAHHYKNLEETLKSNLTKRLEIIEELKGLITINNDINTTYKNFKTIQERWKKAGPVPRSNYNDVWKTFQHHTEIFYDFLDINRELRDIDFKKNLEEKEKIIAKAEQLLGEEDVHKAFRELQLLHKVWKEDIGPVDQEHRETVWEHFSVITKAILQKREEYFKNLENSYEENLAKKQDIVRSVEYIASHPAKSHQSWQNQIKEIEALRKSFFSVGKVPRKANEEVWTIFKKAITSFNKNKNAFYKNFKKEQSQNLEKKMELLKIAESLKDSEDWAKTTPIMKEIQIEWGKTGYIPKAYSNKLWEKFKNACNHYFNHLHEQHHNAEETEHEVIEKKKAFLDELRQFKISSDKENDIETIKAYLAKWKSLGKIPHHHLEAKFNKTIDALFAKLNVDKQQIELIKYGNKLEHLATNHTLLSNERLFIERRINELKTEIRQLENNLQFISNAKEDNPIVKEVVKTINKHKEDLSLWVAKLKELKAL